MDENEILNTLNYSTKVDSWKTALAELYLHLQKNPNNLILVGNMKKLFNGLK